MKPQNRTCRQCGGDFIATDPRKHFCTKRCSQKAGEARRIRTTLPETACAHCKKEFKKRRKSQVYCGLKCKRTAQGVKPRKPRATIPCRHCGKNFEPLRADSKFCGVACAQNAAYAVRRAKSAAALKTVRCAGCNVEFQQRRKDQKYCSAQCYGRKYTPKSDVLPTPAASKDAPRVETARLFADGFYLGGLREEIERVRKTPRLAATLEAQLRQAMIEDAVWPIGKVGRIALTLALLKDNSLLGMPVKWRHPHEHRRRPGDPFKPSGIGVRAYGRPGSRA